MITVLAIHTYPKAFDTLIRHMPYFVRQKADALWVINTHGDKHAPEGIKAMEVGDDSYINGPVLPQRMLDTIESFFHMAWDILILAEYDTVFFNRIKVENMKELMAAHYAGGPTWGSKAHGFYHNPWVFKRIAAYDFVFTGKKAISEGVCGGVTNHSWGTAEASPDVFFAYVAEKMRCKVQSDLWREFSRNDMKGGRLDLAIEAFKAGVDVIHGIKTQTELEQIIGQNL